MTCLLKLAMHVEMRTKAGKKKIYNNFLTWYFQSDVFSLNKCVCWGETQFIKQGKWLCYLYDAGNCPDLPLWTQIAGGLAGETPYMISAAVKGLARLVYEFSDLISAAYNLLPSAFLLLQRKNREIIKVPFFSHMVFKC